MKSFQIAFFFLLSTIFSFATDFGAGPDVYARAYERARTASYQVYGDGIENGYYIEIDYGQTVTNSAQLMAPFETKYGLRFANYKDTVYEQASVTDADGKEIFIYSRGWKPEEILSSDGKTLSYRMPEYAGRIWLQLADQLIEFDGDAAEVVLDSGWTYNLEVRDGYVVVPGWIYQQHGAFVEWIGNRRIVTDIQTGLPVCGGKEILQVRQDGVDGITVREASGRFLSIYTSWDWDTTFEVTMPETGKLNLWMGDWYNQFPQGVYITVVGTGLPPVYCQPNKEGLIYFDVKKGQTLHIKQYWLRLKKG